MPVRGFVLGKFMPPHAGHVSLCRAASALVDELTILVCSLPGDDIAGADRARWMQELFPAARVRHVERDVPQQPEDSEDFWPIWTAIVKEFHPEPIDRVFAGENYGADLAQRVGGVFIPLGARIAQADEDALGGVSGTAVRADPAAHWSWLPRPVRRDMVKTVALHGVESVGKSTLAAQLANALGTSWVPEYGRAHCEVHGNDCTEQDLQTIAAAHQAMIEAAREWSGPVLFSDTDWLMTRAWHRMMLGRAMEGPRYPLADLYIHLPPDLPWVDDGARIYGEDDKRATFDAMCRGELTDHAAPFVTLNGPPEDRLAQALAALKAHGIT